MALLLRRHSAVGPQLPWKREGAEKDSHFGQVSGLEHVVGGGPRVFVIFLFHIRKEQPLVRRWTTNKPTFAPFTPVLSLL
jgi:hypothetical protein